jgi:hypothetical protein
MRYNRQMFGFRERRNPTGHKIWIIKNATENPNRTNFHTVLNRTIHTEFLHEKHEECQDDCRFFYSFNGDTISREAVAPSQLTNKNPRHNNKIGRILLALQ